MANTHILIDKTNLTTSQSGVTFSSIPQIYTDLYIVVSGRSTESDNASSFRCYFNGDTGNITTREIRSINTTVASYDISYAQAGYVAGGQSQANTFGVSSIYVVDYTSSNYKISQAETVQPSNTAGESYCVLSSRIWSSTNPITSVTLTTGLGVWVSGSSFYLYGIKNS